MFDFPLAIVHHLLVFALFGILAIEAVLVRRGMTAGDARVVASIDIWYGVLAGGIVVAGFTRAIFAAKGWPYYSHNAFFCAKMSTFAVVGALSVIPTLRIVRWNRLAGAPSPVDVARTRRFIYAEIAAFALLPIFAAAMARGFGEFG